jgi:hypothetical protein
MIGICSKLHGVVLIFGDGGYMRWRDFIKVIAGSAVAWLFVVGEQQAAKQ